MKSNDVIMNFSKRNLFVFTSILLVLLLFFSSYYYYNNEIEALKKEKGEELRIIADLKIKQIYYWYDDEMDDAGTITKNLFQADNHIEREIFYDQNKSNHLKEKLSYLKEEHGYNDIIIVSKNGKPIVSTTDSLQEFSLPILNAIDQAFKNGNTTCTDFYRSSGNDIFIDFVSPVEDDGKKIIGFTIYRIDANLFQFPLISFWPNSSETSETFVVRKEQDSVVIINGLRHYKNSALNIKIPLTQNELATVKAAEGYKGIFEGKDYKGKDVFAYICPVEKTPWFLVAKIDKEELFQDFYLKIASVYAILILLFLFIGMSISYLYANKQKGIYKKLWQTEEEYRTILYSIGDAVIITDKKGNVQNLNPVAENCTGWSEIDAKDEPLEKVFCIINEKTREKVPSPIEKILKTGLPIGLANHTLLISRTGNEIPIADSGAPIKNAEGNILGTIIVFRDQTEERKKQKALEENDALIRSILDNLPMGVAVNSINPDVNFNYMNDNFPKIYRTSREELSVYDSFWELVYEDPVFREEIKQRVINDCDSGIPERMHWDEIPITRKGQETTYVSARNIPIPDKNLQISTVWDVTEQINAQKEIRENEHKFRSLFENHSSAKLIIDSSDGSIVDANDAAVAFYGWSKEELKQMKIFQINILDVATIREKMKLAGVDSNKYFEFKHRIKSGEIRDVEIFSSNVELSGKQYLYTIVNDTTERKKADNQIKLLSRSIEQSPVIVVITNSEGNIEYVNPKFEKISGYHFDEVKGKNMRIFKSGFHNQEFYADLWNTILSGKDWQGEIQNKKKNGELFWENSLISPITNLEGEITHFVAVKEDITENKKILEDLIIAKEKAEESDRLKTAFLANMSHEIRTPLNGILGFIDLLGKPDLNNDQSIRFRAIIKKSSARLLATINDIIEISKIESGQLNIYITEVNVNELMQYVHLFFKPEAESRKLSLICGPILPENYSYTSTDKDKLESILINLIKNAIKFTEKGFVEFGCQYKNSLYEFYVKDSGTGIPENKQKIIFNRFVQGDTSVTKPHEGSGLGLSISKAYVEKLGGKIWINSKPGEGSTFYFTIGNLANKLS